MRIDEVRQLIEQGEGQTIEFKDSRILSSPMKLAKEMVALHACIVDSLQPL